MYLIRINDTDPVIPAKAGTSLHADEIPAFAGMTHMGSIARLHTAASITRKSPRAGRLHNCHSRPRFSGRAVVYEIFCATEKVYLMGSPLLMLGARVQEQAQLLAPARALVRLF